MRGGDAAKLGDVCRFRNSRQISSFAGLDPGVRERASKRKDLGISRAGSRMLRWAMIQLPELRKLVPAYNLVV